MKQRALEVHGSEESIEESRQQRVENKEKAKQKKFDKKVKGKLKLKFRAWNKECVIIFCEHNFSTTTPFCIELVHFYFTK